jgi:hypothetical protein
MAHRIVETKKKTATGREKRMFSSRNGVDLTYGRIVTNDEVVR